MKNNNIKSKSIMIQGTASSVGKSILCTALCRIFTQDGYNVNPFKSQNMALNSYVTPEGHEMGRAQVMQAEAAGKIPSSCMNPILLKPASEKASQVIINGKAYANMDAAEYSTFKPSLRNEIANIYNELAHKSDIIVIEGAGSPAEINLNKDDFVNMGMAEIADAPVILVGDIDKGGVFASLAGTMLLLSEKDRKRVKGVIINKFRGSMQILEPGLRMLEDIIKVPVLGVIPYFRLNLEDEDSISEWLGQRRDEEKEIDIAIIKLPYMSNHTDFNCFSLYEDVSIRFVEKADQLGKPDAIILPGTKNTMKDMSYLQESNIAAKIIESWEKGCYVFGICGGFQMLGKNINDITHAESDINSIAGLGLLDIDTDFQGTKITTVAEGYDSLFNSRIKGYEIHMGATKYNSSINSFSSLTDVAKSRRDGAVSEDFRVIGTYLHGIFDNSEFTRKYLNMVRKAKGLKPITNMPQDYRQYKDEQYNKLADIVRQNLDVGRIYKIIEEGKSMGVLL